MPLGACWSRSGKSERRTGADRLVDGAPVGRVVARLGSLQWPLAAPVCAHQPDLLGAPAIAHEADPAPVRRPGGAAVEPRRGRHAHGWRAVEPGDPHVGVAGGRAGVGERLPGRAPGRCSHRAGLVDDQSRLAAAHRGRPQLVAGASNSRRTRSSYRPATSPARRRPPHPRPTGACGCRPSSSRRGRAHPRRRSTTRSAVHRETRQAGCLRLPDWRSGRAERPCACRRRRSRCCRCGRSRTRVVGRLARRSRRCRREEARAARHVCCRRPASLSRQPVRLPRSPQPRSSLRTQPRRRRPSRRRSRARRATRNRPTRTLPACGYFYHGRCHRTTVTMAPAQGFPSGQRGRAVNPLAQPSEVRILSPAFSASAGSASADPSPRGDRTFGREDP